jgi:hypothetical protein
MPQFVPSHFLIYFSNNILLTVLFVSSYYCFFLELMVNFVIVTPYLKCSACFTRSVPNAPVQLNDQIANVTANVRFEFVCPSDGQFRQL